MAYMLSTWEKDAAGVLLICTLPCTYMHRNMYPYRHTGANPMWVCASILWGSCASAWVIVFFSQSLHAQRWGDMVLPGPCMCWYVFLCMHVHGHMHVWSMPAASFSCVFSVYPCLFLGVRVLSGACVLLRGLGLGGCRLKHDSACLRGAGVTRVCMMGAGEHCWALS